MNTINRLVAFALAIAMTAFVLPVAPLSARDGGNVAAKLQDAFADVIDAAAPSVVIIRSGKSPGLSEPQQDPDEMDSGNDQGGINIQIDPRIPRNLLKELLNPRKFHNPRGLPPQEQPRPLAQGSGFFIREDGYLLTNNHVVGDQSEFTVILKDGREFKGEVVGTDPKTDLAVLKVKSDKPDEKFPVLKFADSDKVRIGHWAIAIGAPFTLDYTVTIGVVSHKGRSMGMNAYENYIQTDTAINPGNSGGPLLNVNGEVIGVVDFILTPQGLQANVGLSFAIASNLAKDVSDQLITGGEVVRAWIGIAMEPVPPDTKKDLKIEGGALVREVRIGEPADKAGLKPGDIILKVDGIPVKETKDVQSAILKHKPGEKIRLALKRQGADQEIEVVAGRQRRAEMAGATDAGQKIDDIFEKYGIRLGEKENQVMILDTVKGSIADKAGLHRGMAVFSINKKQVRNMDDVMKIAEAAIKEKYLLLYVGDGTNAKQYFALSLL